MSALTEVVEVVARALADRPDAVRVTESEKQGVTVVELAMAPADMGRIVGRQGKTAAALRTLVGIAADRAGITATLEFKDEAGGRSR